MNRPFGGRSEVADRDRSPVAACGPRQHLWKITHALVFARPLRAGTARGANLTPIFPHIPLARHQHALLLTGHKVRVFRAFLWLHWECREKPRSRRGVPTR